MRRRFFLLYNPNAGRARVAFLDRVVTAIEAAGGRVERHHAASAEAARSACSQAARSGAWDAVVAAGGDGTIRQVAAGVRDSGCAMGVVPLGTGNVLSHEFDLPRERPVDVARMLIHGVTTPIELATANGEPFMLMAGVGFDGRVIATLDHELKSMIGKTAYVPTGLAAILHELDELEVRIDGMVHPATWAVVCNARHFGGGFVMAPGTHLSTPGLQAVLFRSRSRMHFARQLVGVAAGLHRDTSEPENGITFLDCEEAQITSRMPVEAEIDGDAFATTPLAVRSGGGRVDLILPPR